MSTSSEKCSPAVHFITLGHSWVEQVKVSKVYVGYSSVRSSSPKIDLEPEDLFYHTRQHLRKTPARPRYNFWVFVYSNGFVVQDRISPGPLHIPKTSLKVVICVTTLQSCLHSTKSVENHCSNTKLIPHPLLLHWQQSSGP